MNFEHMTFREMQEAFYDYLRDKGFTAAGADELIGRVAKGKPDREDLYQLRSFQRDTGAVGLWEEII